MNHFLLTVLKLCNDGAGFQRSANSKFVDCRHSELIFISFDEFGCSECALLTLIRHQGPGNL